MVDFTTKNNITILMQLFHTDQFEVRGSMITISDDRVLHQLKRVLRARVGHQFCLQSQDKSQTMRYTCQVSLITDSAIQGQISHVECFTYRHVSRHLVVAMANRWDKMELIIQKITECGVSDITIVPMNRSMITTYNDHKWKRLESIMLEATEQSWSTQIPTITWCNSLKDITFSGQVLVCNMGGILCNSLQCSDHVMIVIGPEGGLDAKDLTLISSASDYETISLGSSVLRMETAAIVTAWWINQ